jgi:hypothetical protein
VATATALRTLRSYAYLKSAGIRNIRDESME